MTKTPINTSLPRNPSVRLADKLNSTFIGKLTAKRSYKDGEQDKFVYEFEKISGDAPTTQLKDGAYREVQVDAGETVNLFGTTILNRAIDQVKIGAVLEIKYTGTGKKRLQMYDVAVIE